VPGFFGSAKKTRFPLPAVSVGTGEMDPSKPLFSLCRMKQAKLARVEEYKNLFY
jgi:hypothetical protein